MKFDHKETFRAYVLPCLLAFYLVFSFCLDSLGFSDNLGFLLLMDWQRIFELLTLAIGLLCCIFDKRFREGLLGFPAIQIYGWILFFLLAALSCTFAVYPRFAFAECSRLLASLLLFVYLAINTESNNRVSVNLIYFFVLSVLVIYTPLYYIENSIFLFDDWDWGSPNFVGFYNPRAFSDYQAAILFLAPWALRQLPPSPLVRSLGWCLLASYGALAFVAGSRSQLLGVIAVFLLVFFALGRESFKNLLKEQARLWLFAFLAYLLLFHVWPFIIYGGFREGVFSAIRYTSSGRIELWRMAFEMALDNPWFGVGRLHFAATLNPIAASPHSLIIQIMAEFGFPALIVSITLFLFWFSSIRKGILSESSNAGKDHDMFAVSLFCSFSALLAHSCVSGVFSRPQGSVLLILLGGILTGSARASPYGKPFFIHMKISVFVSLAALLILTATTVPWSLEARERNNCYLKMVHKPSHALMPRFWAQGWLYKPCEPSLR